MTSSGACAGEFLGFGTDCTPSCCETVAPTGGDDCDSATVLEVVVPPLFGGSNTYHIFGNNSTATYDDGTDCSIGWEPLGSEPSEDLGWFEAFELVDDLGDPVDCARVTIDFCCTDSEAPSVYWVLIDGCSETGGDCGNTLFRDEYGYGPSASDPACDDDSLWFRFNELPGGTYHLPINSDQLDPTYFGDYHIHITVEACTPRACCLPGCPSDCQELTQTACEAAGGFYLPDDPTCASLPCDLGACCAEPGQCEDADGVGWACDDPSLPCSASDWIGGARCDDNPCPVLRVRG